MLKTCLAKLLAAARLIVGEHAGLFTPNKLIVVTSHIQQTS